jgi:hypothetical protein
MGVSLCYTNEVGISADGNSRWCWGNIQKAGGGCLVWISPGAFSTDRVPTNFAPDDWDPSPISNRLVIKNVRSMLSDTYLNGVHRFQGRQFFQRSWCGLCVIGCLVLLIGCGGGTPPPSPPTTQTKISSLGRLYGEYAARHDGVGPEDEASFRSFLESLPPPQRKSMGLENVAEALVSPRDGAPYVIIFGVEPRSGAANGQPGTPPSAPGQSGLRGQAVVIHEQTGQDGKRLVATAFGSMDELAEAEFAKAVP